MVYIPNYDALLVPAPDARPYSLQGPPVVHGLADALQHQPPRRRRPILAILDLLQKRYNLHAADLAPSLTRPDSGFSGVKSGESEVSSNTTTSNATQTSTEDGKGGGEGCKTKDTCDSGEGAVESETTEAIENSESDDQVQVKDTGKVAQISKIYSLLDSLMKDHPDINDGFSYAYKYRVPHAPTSFDNVELSVQQSLNRFPQLAEDPVAHNILKKPVNYEKAQEKLDSILEDNAKKGTPVHLNTPGAFGPLLLNRYLEHNPVGTNEDSKKENDSGEDTVVEAPEERNQKATKLILRPVAKAVAGPRGVAVASPVARAILRRGQKVTVEYEPDAVAIAGPGGRAHAHPQFSMEYIDKDGEY